MKDLSDLHDHPILRLFYRPPYIGIVALAVALGGNPMSHSLVRLITHEVAPANAFLMSLGLGLIGVTLVVYASIRGGEALGTLFGFLGGLLVWTGWCAFGFRFNGYWYDLKPVDEMGAVILPTNLHFLQGSIGVLAAMLVFLMFNKDTKCNAFRWVQRTLRLKFGEPASAQERDIARITFLETVFVIWFFYAVSLFLGDERFLGQETVGYFVVWLASAVWGIYLLYKLFKHTRVMAGIRYAIPTKSIVWFTFEQLDNMGFREPWLYPWEYKTLMIVLLVVFLGGIVAALIVPARRLVQRR